MWLVDGGEVVAGTPWGFLGVVASTIGAISLAFVARKRHKDDDPSEKVAANTASQEILDWVEEHVIDPIRDHEHHLEEQLKELQGRLKDRDAQLLDASRSNIDLRSRLEASEARLLECESQVRVLVTQLANQQHGEGRAR